MGQVTIGELTEALVPFTEKGNKIVDVAIVPRAIVEKIIFFCVSDANLTSKYDSDSYNKGWHDALNRVKERADYLLSEFEKEVAGVEK